MKKIHTILLFMTLSMATHAQIAVNGDNTGEFSADPSSVLDIRASGKGVLMPILSKAERISMKVDSVQSGLLVLQGDGSTGFYLVDSSGHWQLLNSMLLPDMDNMDTTGISLSPVAYSGSWNDLVDRPEIPQGKLSAVAYSGSWNDLVDRPVIPGSPQDIAQVSYSGSYNDLTVKPSIVTTLRELAQDSLHRLVGDAQKERWNEASGREIPTSLSDLEGDAYYRTVTLEERENWTSASHRIIPRKVSDLKEDEFSRSVTDSDIRRWDSAAALKAPTRLSELEQDSLHRLLTQAQIDRYNTFSSQDIPRYVSDLTGDYAYRGVSEEQIAGWETMVDAVRFSGDYNDLTDKPVIPDSLCQIYTDMQNQLVNRDDTSRWNAMLTRQPLNYLYLYEQDSLHLLPSVKDVARWEEAAGRDLPEISTAAISGDYNDIPEKYQYVYSNIAISGNYADINDNNLPQYQPVAVSGDYNDLTERPESTYPRNFSYKDLPDTVRYLRVALTGQFKDLTDYEDHTALEDYAASSESQHVGRSTISQWNGILESAYADIRRGDFQGKLPTMRIANDIELPPSLQVNSWGYDTIIPSTLATAGTVATQDENTAAGLQSVDNIPPCTVVMWASNGALPEGWSYYKPMAGRFLRVEDSEKSGGSETETLTLEQMPRHTHGFANKNYLVSDQGANKDNRVTFEPDKVDRPTVNNTAVTYMGGDVYGATHPHENRPPYYAIYFIYKSEGCSVSP